MRQRRNQWIVASLTVAAVVAIAWTIFFMQQHNSAIARVSVQQDRITRVQDDGGNLKTISRKPNLELFYRVTLKDCTATLRVRCGNCGIFDLC
ncbi:MAG: hypothetical protein KME60_01155 [Cyanomargarita calcarea GSE-NOS-MK-12-04C]|uniref:Uncharacterized protein n=1 Tax=Cyanomargarita calcarea GSE-NOS-MK-12-04C TaxID=2839659 RepID=A0A951QGU4_9CYAN|nr:hypothetical protein [Cyanomargarita calcarea GSE-NOS-MK-12-04C]